MFFDGELRSSVRISYRSESFGLSCYVTPNNNYRSFSLSRSKKINRKPFNGLSQEIVILLKIDEEDSSPSFRSVRSPKPQIFVEMFRRNLQSPVWKRHVGAHQMCTNMAAGKWCKHLELMLAI